MKKTFKAAVVTAFMFVSAVAVSAKEKSFLRPFDAPNASVCGYREMKILSGGKDFNIKEGRCMFNLDIVNKTNETGIPVKVYTAKKIKGGEWIEVGEVTLGVPGSVTSSGDEFGAKYEDYKFFALVPQNGKKYLVTMDDDFQYYYAFAKKWVVLTVHPLYADEDLSYQENAVTVKKADFDPKGKFKDNIKFVNETGETDFSVSMYGFNEDGWPKLGKLKVDGRIKEQILGQKYPDDIDETSRIWIYGYNVNSKAWNALTAATFAAGDEKNEVDGNFHPIYFNTDYGPAIYHNYGFVFSNGKKYNVQPELKGKDLIITILPE